MESEFPESHVLDRSRSIFLDLIKSDSRVKVGFLDSVKLGIGFLIAFRNYFTFLQYLFYISSLDSQKSDGGAVHRQAIKQLPRPAPGDARLLLSDRNSFFGFLVYREMTKI